MSKAAWQKHSHIHTGEKVPPAGVGVDTGHNNLLIEVRIQRTEACPYILQQYQRMTKEMAIHTYLRALYASQKEYATENPQLRPAPECISGACSTPINHSEKVIQ